MKSASVFLLPVDVAATLLENGRPPTTGNMQRRARNMGSRPVDTEGRPVKGRVIVPVLSYPENFAVKHHHTRMMTKAAVVRDATMIREQV
jgi:hypothetical protein